ncbi:hypothetical protein [Streptomyces sp. NPDC018000]|uniref:hypothetical protein n=1 Tax=Streptomyces sp. NPDC018000 TaxID=3365028 RepID=UPI0037B6860C
MPKPTSGRLHAVLDVTEPELPPVHSPLYDLHGRADGRLRRVGARPGPLSSDSGQP